MQLISVVSAWSICVLGLVLTTGCATDHPQAASYFDPRYDWTYYQSQSQGDAQFGNSQYDTYWIDEYGNPHLN